MLSAGNISSVDCRRMDPQLYKRVFARILDAFEPIAYLTIAFALSVPIVTLVVSAVMTMLDVTELGFSKRCLPS
jgi:ABC-type enterochelin transport system permease subunit